MMTLVFNEKKYAELDCKNLGDCNGFFSTSSNGVKLFKPTGELEAFIVNNERQGYFAVTAGTDSRGVPFYMFSTNSLTEKWLGIEGMGMCQEMDTIKAIRFVDDVLSPSQCQVQNPELLETRPLM